MTLYWNNVQDVQTLKLLLDQGKIVVTSGDTVLGLVGMLTQNSYDRLNQIKDRFGKPYLILIRSVEMLPKFIDQQLSPKIVELTQKCWPGPITLIFKARADLPAFMKSNDGTIAVRVPHHKGLLELLKNYDGLFSTSANIHSEPIPQSLSDLAQSIKNEIGAICIDEGNSSFLAQPSTILDCSKDKIVVVRKGGCLTDSLQEIIDKAS